MSENQQPTSSVPAPSRKIFQCRPGMPGQGENLNKLYSPQRDLAYIFPEAAREAFESLDEVNWKSYFGDILREKGITEHDLATGVQRFVEAFHFFVGDPTIQSLDDALDRTKFFDVTPLVRMVIFERLGEVCTAGFFVAIRDVSRVGQNPPQTDALVGFEVAAQGFVQRLHGEAPPQRFLSTAERFQVQLKQQLDATIAELEYTKVSLKNQKQLTEAAERRYQEAERARAKALAELAHAALMAAPQVPSVPVPPAKVPKDLGPSLPDAPPWWRSWFHRK